MDARIAIGMTGVVGVTLALLLIQLQRDAQLLLAL